MSDELQNDNSHSDIADRSQSSPLLWAKRAALGYLAVAVPVLALTWNGSYELGPRWNLVALFSWPVSALALQAFDVVAGIFGVALDDDDLKIPAVLALLLTGTIYWGLLGYWGAWINNWRKRQ